jgi:lactate racemase
LLNQIKRLINMEVKFRYGKEEIGLKVPKTSQVFKSGFGKREKPISELLIGSISNPVGCLSLKQQLKKRKKGNIVIVVSDITRPIPYRQFLPELIDFILSEGTQKDEITILVATGMHRASTSDEKVFMFGREIVENYRIIDHDAEDEDRLAIVEGESWSGAEVKLNKYYVEAGFRILTGLVEPHFMAGFSGGRKAICPGLVSLATVKKFHGYQFLSQPDASNGILKNNPLHLEASSIAKLCPSDFSINIVLDQKKEINSIISGEQFLSHDKAVEYVKKRSFVTVKDPVDLAVTSCGGYPLDDTFYQCVKGFVNCLPAVKGNGEIIAFGGCNEGIGSREYELIMKKYTSRPDDFLKDIRLGSFFKKDQWQFQMHIRALKKVGIENLHFFTTGITEDDLGMLSVTPHSVSQDELVQSIQSQIDTAVNSGKRIGVFPEGPYCSPL